MGNGSTTWALVVGIDEYELPSIPRLRGAAADAIAVVEWLRKLQVPDSQIFVHAAPSATTRPALDALGIKWQDAREAAIWDSAKKLQAIPGGTRLFVFLSGHGLYEPSSKRLFLTQESGINDAWTNIGIDLYIDFFLSTAFPLQFLVMDGCQNYPYPKGVRPTIMASMPSGVRPDQFTPKETNSLTACFAATVGQLAQEIEGRGAFLRRLMPAMDPSSPMLEAVTLDFETGQRWLDIVRVMHPYVASQVATDAQNLTPSQLQTPQAYPMGLRPVDGRSPVFEIADPAPVSVTLDIAPPVATADVESVRIWVNQRPFWDLSRPDPTSPEIDTPLVARFPPALPVRVEVKMRTGANWNVAESSVDTDTTEDRSVVFRMTQRLGPGEGASPPETQAPLVGPDSFARVSASDTAPVATTILAPALEPFTVQSDDSGAEPGHGGFASANITAGADLAGVVGHAEDSIYSVKVFGNGGRYPFSVLQNHYPEIESNLGLDLPAKAVVGGLHGPESPWLRVGRGIRMQRHETGPVFWVKPGSTGHARRMVDDWVAAVQRVVGPTFIVHAVVRDPAVAATAPNLRFVLASTPVSLAGPLRKRESVTIGPPGQSPQAVVETVAQAAGRNSKRTSQGVIRTSLDALGIQPLVRVNPGPVEIRVDLPWGSWSDIVVAPSSGKPATIRVPRSIGTPSLRVRLADQLELEPRGYTIYGLGGRAPLGHLVDPDGTPGGALVSADRRAADWALKLPARNLPADGTAVVRLERPAQPDANFPILHNTSLAVKWSTKGLWVEPLSKTDSPEWDLLLATGRLDALTPEQADQLTRQKWFDAILGLAGAYAVYSRADWPTLRIVTANLRRISAPGIDVDLLEIVGNRSVHGRLSREAKARLSILAEQRQVPLLRWGVPLALELIGAAAPNATPWAADLARIDATLSPISAWTAWNGTPVG
ncbi:MAG: hypothetical protein QOH61_1170 [Chloroflexota bacterium]|jgi:hypothetical protein|nr:hypothetical protein [Chloroflexota bacterium]